MKLDKLVEGILKKKCFLFLIILQFPIMLFSIHSSIGTYLNIYFFKLLTNSAKNKPLPESEIIKIEGKKSNEVLDFYQALPDFIDLTTEEMELLASIPKIRCPVRAQWNPAHWKQYVNEYYVDYHKVVASVSQRIIKNTLEKIGFEKKVEYPVIHYRLSDVPFCRSQGHHLYKYSFYLWALGKISFNDETDKTVIVVSSNNHRCKSKMKIAAEEYLASFIQYLNEHGYKVLLQNGSIIEDFATMVYAPALISSSSAFSFHAGLANDRIFLSGLLGHESKGKFYTVKNCDWMSSSLPLLHVDVDDYLDTESVIKQLKDEDVSAF